VLRVFSISVPKRTLLLAAVDYTILVLAFTAAIFAVDPVSGWMYMMYESGLEMVLLVAVAGSFGLYLTNAYTRIRVASRTTLFLDLCQALGFLFLLKATVMYLHPEIALPRTVMVLGSGLSIVVLFGWRMSYSSILRHALLNDRVLFIGYRPELEDLAQFIRERPQLGLTTLGYVGSSHPEGAPKHIGDLENIDEILEVTRPDRVIVGADMRDPAFRKAMFSLQAHRANVERLGVFYERVMSRVSSAELRPSSVILDRELHARPRSLALQSIYTNLLALLSTVLLAIPMMLVALVIRLSTRQRALQLHTRIGLNGVPFNLYRFNCYGRDGRLTRLGRWLRRHRIDQLPQLLNVFRGEMSLIGPEPHRPEFVAVLSALIPYYGERHIVRPGLIGWSQLKTDSRQVFIDEIVRLEYDLYYIKHISLTLDFYIVLTNLRHAIAGVSNDSEAPEEAELPRAARTL
jgi:lipopolysaccharide/colanic/teichoic acid biosynthesis glycosyltransferase